MEKLLVSHTVYERCIVTVIPSTPKVSYKLSGFIFFLALVSEVHGIS
jgi:hypothetical protein